MKFLFLLFAVVFLVFQTQCEAAAVANNEAEAQAPDQVEAEAQDEIMAEDDDAEISSPGLRGRGGTEACQNRRGVCRKFCLLNEHPSGRCFTGRKCCNKSN